MDSAGRAAAKLFSAPYLISAASLTAILVAVATVFRHPILTAFELYDHPLNDIAFNLLSRFAWLPPRLTHDLVMAVGFAALGLTIVGVAFATGAQRAWIAAGIVLLWLNLLWAYSVELEVAESLNRPLAQSLTWAALSTYVANSAGALLGAWCGAVGGSKFRVTNRQAEVKT